MKADWYRGFRAGLKLSLIMYIVNLVIGLFYSEVILRLYGGYFYYWDRAGPYELAIWLMSDLITVIVICAIIGFLFGLLHERLPGQRNPTSGMVLFVPIWSIYISIEYLLISSHMHGMPFMPAYLLVWILPAFLYGYYLGHLWDREEPVE